MSQDSYPRDLIGYGRTPPHAAWPGGARIAVQCVLNYEEGAEANILDGDQGAEVFLSDIANAAPVQGARHMSMEQIYEYGSRAGVWRLLRLFARYDVPLTIFGVALAMQRNPAVVEAFLEAGHEIASHGWRWINYQYVSEAEERADLARAIAVHTQLTGERPLGWYTGRTSPNTRRIVAEEGGFLYDADDYSDDLPFWTRVAEKRQLIVPYSLETNDMRFASANMHTGDEFFAYLRDTFDTLYAEGEERPRMMSVGLHCRLAGRPGKIAGLERFLRHALAHRHVWFCRRIDIARHWRATHPHAG
ncbi:allantoinase PuuE [Sphingomonas sp. LB-2]|uniref:allantoinase PuuE n=1 Tax=Sphingomonas caeni TaxID=2984949 RepID=UPI00222ECF56|nr:allantoinase PuuE [Sphingomonas caeni]MCW3846641.1 allantoinase PuuE [Sphingomonas caeni]